MCTNEKQQHPWCENTVSHHGVDLVGSFSKRNQQFGRKQGYNNMTDLQSSHSFYVNSSQYCFFLSKYFSTSMRPKLLLTALIVLLLSALIAVKRINHSSQATHNIEKSSNNNFSLFEAVPIEDAIGPESFAFDPLGEGPYTGISDGRIIKWQQNQQRWINFAITSPERYALYLITHTCSTLSYTIYFCIWLISLLIYSMRLWTSHLSCMCKLIRCRMTRPKNHPLEYWSEVF